MYPPLRQFISYDPYQFLGESHRPGSRGGRPAPPADLPFPQRAWLVVAALLVMAVVAGGVAVAAIGT